MTPRTKKRLRNAAFVLVGIAMTYLVLYTVLFKLFMEIPEDF